MIASGAVVFNQSRYILEMTNPLRTLMLDVRSLDDPEGEGIGENGLDLDVIEYVMAQPLAEEFLGEAQLAHNDGFSVVFMCFGGKNRSVVLANELARRNNKVAKHFGLEEWAKVKDAKV